MTTTRGEVWIVNLDPTIGDEIRKTRPAVIVNSESTGVLDLRVVVPFTAWQDQFEDCDWLVRIEPDDENGLDKTSAADTFQVRSISSRRFVRRLGKLAGSDLDRVAIGLIAVLDLQ